MYPLITAILTFVLGQCHILIPFETKTKSRFIQLFSQNIHIDFFFLNAVWQEGSSGMMAFNPTTFKGLHYCVAGNIFHSFKKLCAFDHSWVCFLVFSIVGLIIVKFSLVYIVFLLMHGNCLSVRIFLRCN